MKTFILSTFFLLSLSVSSWCQIPPIVWSTDYKLSWDDFKAKPSGNMFEAAKSTFKINFKYQGAYKEGELVFSFDVSPQFIPNESWYISDRANEALLVHEQLHFDITELFARKMRKRFNETTFSKEDYDKEIKDLYKKTMNELNNYRSVYNSETFFGAKLDKQLAWNEKVAKALENHSAYIK